MKIILINGDLVIGRIYIECLAYLVELIVKTNIKPAE